MATYKVRLIVEGMEKRNMEGYVFRDDIFDLRDKLCEAVKNYEDTKKDDDPSKRTHEEIDNAFYDMTEKVIGYAVNGEDDHWVVRCPICDKEYEYQGFFDPEDVTVCRCCGVKFTTTEIVLNDKETIRY